MITPRAEVRRYFRQTSQSSAPGTFWRLWGGWVTAHHVHEAQSSMSPPFIGSSPMTAGDLIDAALYGCNKIPTLRPREPKPNERITIFGYPGGCDAIQRRHASVYLKRQESGSAGYQVSTWIAKIDELPEFSPVYGYHDPGSMYEPVFVGMSGGLVQSDETGEPLGVLVTRGGTMDSDNDGDLEQTCDFVALCDIWDVYANPDASVS